jgi:hypothetical protein
MKKMIVSILALASSSIAFAGSFEGAYVGAGVGGQYTENKNYNDGTNTGKMSDTHFLGQVTAGYGIDLAKDFNLTTNVFFNLSNDKAGSVGAADGLNTIKGKTKNNIGISFEPGYYVNKDTLAYVKLGYARLDSKLKDSTDGGSSNTTLDGFVYGIGAKYHIDKNIFVGAELTEYNYGNNSVTSSTGVSSSYKTNQTTGLINVGYQF